VTREYMVWLGLGQNRLLTMISALIFDKRPPQLQLLSAVFHHNCQHHRSVLPAAARYQDAFNVHHRNSRRLAGHCVAGASR
jgi:hypothetical protein